MKKEFIRDNGNIRITISNIAKMNIIEFLWFDRGKFIKNLGINLLKTMAESVVSLGTTIILLVCIGLLPLVLLIWAIVYIHSAKKEVKRQERGG